MTWFEGNYRYEKSPRASRNRSDSPTASSTSGWCTDSFGGAARFSRRHLDQLVLDVEFVLLAVVQGVALTGLGIEAIQVLKHPTPTAIVLMASGLVFVLSFWAGAMLHAISIVRWPMDLPHYFFYFAVGLLEMITFAQMEHPRAWFGWSCVFFVLGVGSTPTTCC